MNVASGQKTMQSSSPYRRSQALLARARQLIPGGHHLSGRPLLDPERSPMYFERGRGGRCWDVDGNEYIDLIMAYGPFPLGYADPAVDAAAMRQAERGNLLSLNHPLHVEFAEALVGRFPAAQMAVFLKTGSEATTAALRIARRYTGRRKVARCGYHGWHDWCLPEDDFVPAGLGEQVLGFHAAAPETLAALCERNRGEIAAVIVAPEMVLSPTRALFAELVDLAHRHGAVFILDEVKTAFRIRPGSIQQHLGIAPDLTTLSKALGNGWPIAAVVGRREIMQVAAGMHLSATYHGETTAMAAALETLRELDRRGVPEHLWRLGEMLIAGLNAAAGRHRLPARAYGEPLPPMPFLAFEHPDPATGDALRGTFYAEMFRRGILLHPRHLWFPCAAHTEEDIRHALEAADAAMALACACL